MKEQTFPSIPEALLEELERRFPERSARPGDTIEDLFFKGGQRDVIRFLRGQFNIQHVDPFGVKVT